MYFVTRRASHSCFISSTHLREENRRILESRRLGSKGSPVHPKPISRQPSVGASEEEKSVVNLKVEGRNGATYSTCAACRTRQSNVWWKAPKGLMTAVLCDDCGVHWRKYGDLNLKTPKEDNLPSAKQRMAVAEKREGTPLSGPAPKRLKVSNESHYSRQVSRASAGRYWFYPSYTATLNKACHLSVLQKVRCIRQGHQMHTVFCCNSCRSVCVEKSYDVY